MKKVLLTIAASLLGMAMYAQTISHADSIKFIVNSWKANFTCTEHPKVVTFDFTDSTICPEYKSGTTSGTGNVLYQHGSVDFEPQGAAKTTLSTYFSVSDNAMRVDYDQSANITVQGSKTVTGVGTKNWGDLMKMYWVQKVQPTTQTAAFNPFKDTTLTTKDKWALPGDTVKGVMLDLSDTSKRLVTVTYSLIGLPQTDSADLRFDLFDVNGRSTGGHSTKRCIGRPALADNDNGASFHQIILSWANLEGVPWAQGPGMVMGSGDGDLNDEDQKDFSDGYQATWFNLPNGRGWNSAVNTTGPAGTQGLFDFDNSAKNYPAAGGGNSLLVGDSWDIPVDAAHIIGFGFMLNDGPSVLYHTPKFSMLIRSIQIGDGTQTGTCGEYIFGGATAGSQCQPGQVATILVTDSSNSSINTIGGHIQLFATVLPGDATNKKITWYSVLPAGIATLSSTGVLTANGTENGIVTVTAIAQDGSGTTGSEQIAITNQVKLIVHDEAIGAICVGDNVQFDASALSGVVWTSSDTTIAKIDFTGMLVAKTVGTVTITGSMHDGSLLPGTKTIVITNRVFVSSIAVSGKAAATEVEVSKTLQMIATETPANATDTTVTWSVSDTKIATISATGVLTGIKGGTVTVTATSNDANGVSGSATITVPSTGVSILGSKALTISPNPASTVLNVAAEGQVKQVEIVSTLGSIVASVVGQSSISVADLASGIYIVRVTTANGNILVKTFVKK